MHNNSEMLAPRVEGLEASQISEVDSFEGLAGVTQSRRVAGAVSSGAAASYDDVTYQMRRPRAEKPGAIYYVSFGDGGPIKIGFVSGFAALGERLRGLQTGCPYDLILLAVCAGTLATERALHCRFGRKRLRGEWFDPHRELLTHIRGVQRRKDCRLQLPLHPNHALAPEGMKYLRQGGSRTWLVTA